MKVVDSILRDRFEGCLLGLAIGDALGGKFEGQVALVSGMERFDRAGFFAELLAVCESEAYRAKLEAAAKVQTPEDLAELGNRIEALHSVPTAVASFALTPESFEETVSNVRASGQNPERGA
jgi:ADP-ribosylglycohydrolase